MSVEITQEIIDAFRASKPAFSDVTKWPDEVVTEAFCEAFPECGGRGWGVFDVTDCQNFKRRGVFLFAAHWLSIEYTTGAGATDPTSVNPTARLNVAAKSVRDESVTYRVGAIQTTADDYLSLSNYGVQYLRLRRRAGMGARTV
jgi:hypothetical protein